MAKIAAYGTVLELGDGASPEAFDEIPGLRDFEIPSGEAAEIDVTAHDSPNRAKEYIAGLLDTGEIGPEIFYDPTDTVHQDIITLKDSGEVRSWKVTLPDDDGCEIDFEGFVKSFTIGAPVEDALTAQFAIRLTGPVTVTPGT